MGSDLYKTKFLSLRLTSISCQKFLNTKSSWNHLITACKEGIITSLCLVFDLPGIALSQYSHVYSVKTKVLNLDQSPIWKLF